MKSIFLRLFIIFFLSSSLPSKAKDLDLFDQLKSETVCQSHQEDQGDAFKVYCIETSPVVQNQIDSAYETLVLSTYGHAICAKILNADVDHIESHLGVTRLTAVSIAYSCSDPEIDMQPTPYVYVDKDYTGEITKLSTAPTAERRLYTLVISSKGDWPFDSWTDTLRNNTTLVLSDKDSRKKTAVDTFLLQLLAHETAIYFDSQSGVGTQEWLNLPPNRGLSFDDPQSRKIIRALANPLISQVLAFIRAFKVEAQIIKDLVDQGYIDLDFEQEYSPQKFPFLAKDCREECLFSFIKTQAQSLLAHSAELSVFAPMYKFYLNPSTTSSYLSGKPMSHSLTEAREQIIKATEYFMIRFKKNQGRLNFISPSTNPNDINVAHEIEQLMADLLLPMDLKVLKQAKAPKDGPSFLELITTPVLSGQNVGAASGPRPRIRTGNTKDAY